MLWKSTFRGAGVELGLLLHVTVHQGLTGLWCEMENYPETFSPPSLTLSLTLLFVLPFFLSHFEQSQAALRGSDAVHLGWSLTCSAEKRAFGRGHMKTTYALNPQQNPGVRYNGENHFGGKCLERQQSCGNVSETTARPLHFLLVSFSSLGRNCPAGKSNHL